MRTTAAALTALIAASPAPATEKLVIEKITDYAKADDVQSLKLEIEALKKQLTTLAGTAAEGSKATDVKALKTEIETLKKEIGGLTGKMTDAAKAAEAKTVNQVKAADVASLKDEIAVLKKEITALSTKPVNKDETDAIRKEIAALAAKPVNKDETDAIRKEIAALAARPGMKDDVDALRKDVATLNVFLRETLEGKVERGFTHEGLVKRLQKLDDSIDSLSKKMATLAEPRTAGSSPLGRDALTRTTGTVHIVNDYAIEISIVVNGMAHRLEPNAKKDVAVVGGSFKYQLLTNGGIETERSIKDNETITLTIR